MPISAKMGSPTASNLSDSCKLDHSAPASALLPAHLRFVPLRSIPQSSSMSLDFFSFFPVGPTSSVPSLPCDHLQSSTNRSSGTSVACSFLPPHSFSSISTIFSSFFECRRNLFPLLPLAFLAPVRKIQTQRINYIEDQRPSSPQGWSQVAALAASMQLFFSSEEPAPAIGNEARRRRVIKARLRKKFGHLIREQQNGVKLFGHRNVNGLLEEKFGGLGNTVASHLEPSSQLEDGNWQCTPRFKALVGRVQEVRGNEKEEQVGLNRGQEAAIKTFKHLLAGAASATVSRTFVAPLERLKLEYILRGAKENVLEIIQVIVATEGLSGFWRGNVVNVLRTAPFKSVNFFSYDIYRKWLVEITKKEKAANLERLIAGAAAGITATVLCFPLDTIRTKLVAPGGEALGGVVGCFEHMLRTEGFCSLYKGLLPAVICIAPSGAVFYGVYDMLKSSYILSPKGQEDLRRRLEIERKRRNQAGKLEGDLKEAAENLGQLQLGPMRTLLYGALAGICAETVTYPFEVVRRHLQMQDAATRMSAWATCQQLVQKGGLGALYAGLLPSSLQVLPSAALSFLVYDSMKVLLKV